MLPPGGKEHLRKATNDSIDGKLYKQSASANKAAIGTNSYATQAIHNSGGGSI